MTYRSDNDAALARIEALEAENARLSDELDALKQSPATTTTTRAVPALSVLALAIIGGTFVLAAGSEDNTNRPTPTDKDEIRTKSLAANPVKDCATKLAAKPTLDELDEAGAGALSHGRFTCRDEVYTRLTRNVISVEERRILQWWLQAEDTLTPELVRLRRHYTTEILTRNDNGAALYQAYEQAYDDRQAAIDAWMRGPAKASASSEVHAATATVKP